MVRFDLKPGMEADFDKLTTLTLNKIRQHEPGTLLYACHQVDKSPSSRIFYEIYENREAFEKHEGQPYIKDFLRVREQYLASSPRIEILTLFSNKGLPLNTQGVY